MLRPDSRAVTALLTLLCAVGPLSTDLYLPSLPHLQHVFGVPVAQVQLTLSVYLMGFAAAQLLYGSLSDRFGRRPVLIGGMLLYFAASAGCMLADSIGTLIFARFLQAVGACSAPVLARAVVRDVHGPREAARLLAIVGTGMALAPAAAPMLGGYIDIWFGWRANFALLTLFGGAALLAMLVMLAETNRRKDPHALSPARILRYVTALLGDRSYVGYTLTVSAAFCALFAFISGAAFVLIEVMGVRPEHFGLYFASIAVSYMIGQQLGIRLVRPLGSRGTVRLGLLLIFAAGVAMAALSWGGIARPEAVIAPQCLFMLGFGFMMPNSLAAALAAYPHMAGLASSLLGFIQMATASVVGVLVGYLNDGTARPMASTIALMGALALASFVFIVPKRSPI
jgi:DHA1 family bicyclomycin/chloramphenicol resistance-like MFS transporter